jgi:hypothetical protein
MYETLYTHERENANDSLSQREAQRVLVRREYLASKAREYLQRLIKRENGSRDPFSYWKMQEISKEASAMIEGSDEERLSSS